MDQRRRRRPQGLKPSRGTGRGRKVTEGTRRRLTAACRGRFPGNDRSLLRKDPQGPTGAARPPPEPKGRNPGFGPDGNPPPRNWALPSPARHQDQGTMGADSNVGAHFVLSATAIPSLRCAGRPGRASPSWVTPAGAIPSRHWRGACRVPHDIASSALTAAGERQPLWPPRNAM